MSNCFLFSAAFLPRLTLFIFWMAGAIPVNSTPFVVDILCFIFVPRFLIAYWLYEAQAHPLLIFLFILLGFFGGSSTVKSSSNKKRKKKAN